MKTALDSWLFCNTSLTEKLKNISGEARLEVLRNQEGDIYEREILMWSNEQPCWYAKTQIPKETYDAHDSLFMRLHSESLGALIYHNTLIQRISLRPYKISKQDLSFTWLKPEWYKAESVLWLRSSEFLCADKHPFYLYEIYLPGLLRYCHEQTFDVLVPDSGS